MVDKKFLKENNLEHVYKRLRAINEYVITNGHTMEADEMQPQDDNVPQNPNTPQMPPQDGGDGGDMNMPQGDMGGMPPQDGGDGQMPQDAGMQQPPAPDPTMGADAPDDGMDDPMAMGDEMPTDDMGGEDDEVGPDDEVIDVDDLTNSQESAEYKIDGVNDKLSKLLSIAGKFAKAIQANDEKLEDLRAEMERRNPTDMERINLRSQNSQPFNVNPGEYWNDVKSKNPNYQVISDNDVAPNEEDKVYTITDDDLKNFNTSDIAKSFSDYPKDLLGYF